MLLVMQVVVTTYVRRSHGKDVTLHRWLKQSVTENLPDQIIHADARTDSSQKQTAACIQSIKCTLHDYCCMCDVSCHGDCRYMQVATAYLIKTTGT